MNRFIRELRRREVFRTAGLYVGVCWILIEASSVLLPTFGAPEWILRAVIIVTVVGFPVMLVLAWVYDFTTHGIEVQADVTETMVVRQGRKADVVVIGVLAVALLFSVYMNINSGPEIVVEPDPVSILIADFRNETGNALFDGLLEQALNIGVESAPHVTSFERNGALALATRLRPDTKKLDSAVASLVAVREGIRLVLAGSIQMSGSGYELQVDGVDPAEGTTVFEIRKKAGSAETVLQVVGDLSREVREELGDTTLSSDGSPIAETFTAASLEAAKAYTTALQLAYEGRHDDAVPEYQKAIELDPNFGRAFSGLALSQFKLGRTEEAGELWDKALSLMDTMTERERLRTLGLYYASVSRNFENAVQSFSELVEKYPADAAGHNNLAVAAFLTLDFERASAEGRQLMEIYPNSELYRSNFALYAMYSGDFDAAIEISRNLVADNPGYGTAYLPLAIGAVAIGDLDAARKAYADMAAAEASEHTDSLATLGLADLAIYSGNFDLANTLLAGGIEKDIAADNRSAAAVKQMALAQSYAAAGNFPQAVGAAAAGLELSAGISVQVAAAQIFIEVGNADRAAEIGTELSAKLQPQSRAYGKMIQAMIERANGNYVPAVDLLRSAIDLADLWLIRFQLGRTYVEAGFYAEALSEFVANQERRGEASAVFLDDMPSFRYVSTLPYWTARAQAGMGMQSTSSEGYQNFLSLRPQGGPLADDARQRLQ